MCFFFFFFFFFSPSGILTVFDDVFQRTCDTKVLLSFFVRVLYFKPYIDKALQMKPNGSYSHSFLFGPRREDPAQREEDFPKTDSMLP